MHYVNNPPPAEALLMSARSFGNYDLPAALADLIDNSIKAKATLVEISFEFRAGDPMVRVTDNGVGMTETELVAAMRPASSDPEKERAVDDLGRFGWGLKSASFSQCKKLTVITRAENSDFCGASWNLDDCANYRMSILGSDDCSALGLPALKDGKGTHVIWENCDRLSENGELSLNAFDSAASDVCDRLSLIFQRFLDGTARHHKKLQIVVNGNQLEPFDPFMRSHSATTAMEIESLNIAGEQVVFRPYVLPHFSKLTPLESERLGGNSGYVRNQGFYVYRNDRLIIHGTWFDLVKYGELSQLVRISLDISSSLDSWWKISVDKSEAKLPSSLKGRILALVKPLRNRSKRVYRSRGGKLDRFNSGSVWSRYVRNGEVRYRVNRDHPIVATILKQDDIGEMAELLSLIEQQFPVGAFSQDALSRPDDISQVAIKPEQIDDQLNLLAPRLLAELDGDMNLLETTLLEIEPFINFPGIVDRWLREKEWK